MKSSLISTMLAVFLLGACRSDNAVGVSNQLLYHRWQLIQIQEANKAPQYATAAVFITFSANGKISYDEAGYDGACCVPRQFSGNGQTLTLDFSTDQPSYCQYIDLRCTSVYSPKPQWVIEQVDDQVLWLQVEGKRLIHTRAD